MLIFPAGNVPPELKVLHVGFGPDSFIAGSGWFPNYRATNLYELEWLCASTNADRNEQMRQNFGISQKRSSTNFASLVAKAVKANPNIVVMITTQTSAHADQILMAIAAGVKYIMVDKPLVTSLAEWKQVAGAAQSEGTLIFLTYNHTFNAPVHQIRRMAQEIGVKSVRSFFLQSWLNQNHGEMRQFKWRTGDKLCGPLDIWSHAENLASFCIGKPLRSVSDVKLGTGGGHERGEIYTSGTCNAAFDGGVTGIINFDQALDGHRDDIGVIVSLNDGRHVMWSLELGVDNLWVTKWTEPSITNLEHWTRHMRGDGFFDADINSTFTAAPPGHQDGWGTMWQYLFAAAAGAIYRDMGIEFGFLEGQEPKIFSIEVPGLAAAAQTAQFVEAAVLSHEQRGGKEVQLSEIAV